MQDLQEEESKWIKEKERASQKVPAKRHRENRKRPAAATTSEVELALDGKVRVPIELQ